MGGRLIEEDLLTKYNIIDPKSPEGQAIHHALFARVYDQISQKEDRLKKLQSLSKDHTFWPEDVFVHTNEIGANEQMSLVA